MKDITNRYTKDGLTIVWKPSICVHSGNCARGLAEVFRPKEKPWINMDGAALDEIEAQVGQCPSGALSIEKEDKASQQ